MDTYGRQCSPQILKQSAKNLKLESVEKSEHKIHKSAPEPRKSNVNTIYFIRQGKYLNQLAHSCKCLLKFVLPA